VKRFLCAVLVAGVLLTLGGCAGRSEGIFTPDSQVTLVWPSPPDIPRIRYFRQVSGPEDFRSESRTSRMMRWIAGDVEQELPLRAP